MLKHLILVAAGIVALTACKNESTRQLVDNSRIVDNSIPKPLTNQAGRADEGEQIFLSRDRGHCILCHNINLFVEFPGNVGPDLSAVGSRLSKSQLRLRIVDINYMYPNYTNVTMPSYYKIHDLNQVEARFKGQPILSAQEVEDLVAFLALQRSSNNENRP